jgi:hypothetical protein
MRQALDPFPLHLRVDEALVSIARAAFSSSLPLIVPFDEEFAPLIAHVAGEYASPEFAERLEPRTLEAGERPRHMIQFAALRSSSSSRGGRIREERWLESFVELGIVAPRILSMETVLTEKRVRATVLLGAGPIVTEVTSLLGSIVLPPGVPTYAFSTTGYTGMELAPSVTLFDRHVLEALEKRRRELEYLRVPDVRRFENDEEDSRRFPKRRYEYTPYALVAQLLVRELFSEKEESESS